MNSFGIRLIQDKKIASIQTTNEEEIEKTIDESIARTFIANLKSREFWKGITIQSKALSSIRAEHLMKDLIRFQVQKSRISHKI